MKIEDTYAQELQGKSGLPKNWIAKYTEIHLPNSDEITMAVLNKHQRVIMLGRHKIFGTKTYFIIANDN